MKNFLKRANSELKKSLQSGTGKIIVVIMIILLCYPVFSFYELFISENEGFVDALQASLFSVWLVWVTAVSFAVYWKWTRKSNVLFYFTYAFLLITFLTELVIFSGIDAELESNLFDNYMRTRNSLLIPHFFGLALITLVIHCCVWWFKRKAHRE